jgi:hypothetical protein
MSQAQNYSINLLLAVFFWLYCLILLVWFGYYEKEGFNFCAIMYSWKLASFARWRSMSQVFSSPRTEISNNEVISIQVHPMETTLKKGV